MMSMKNSNETIGNPTRYLPACKAVPKLTAPPRNWYARVFISWLLVNWKAFVWNDFPIVCAVTYAVRFRPPICFTIHIASQLTKCNGTVVWRSGLTNTASCVHVHECCWYRNEAVDRHQLSSNWNHHSDNRYTRLPLLSTSTCHKVSTIAPKFPLTFSPYRWDQGFAVCFAGHPRPVSSTFL
jgi:hypothetical protein